MEGQRFMDRYRATKARKQRKRRQLILEWDRLPSPTAGQFVIPDHKFLPHHPSEVSRIWVITDKKFKLGDEPIHHVNAFLEDRMHDWDTFYVERFDEITGIRYYGMMRGKTCVRLLVEFEK
jgi:hypothetical protein